jgi:protein O-GlcNAc transferase
MQLAMQIQQLVELLNAGHFEHVESQARNLVALHPHNGYGWKILGLAMQAQGGNALAEFQSAARLLPKDHESHIYLANAQLDAGQPEGAARSYRRALKIKPDDARAHCGLGNALMAVDQLDEAALCYRRALKLDPDSFFAHYNLGNLLRLMGDLNQAEIAYRRATEIAPQYPEAHYNLGNVLYDLGNLQEAERAHRRATELMPNSGEAHFNLGKTLYRLGDIGRAVASFRRAVQIRPDYLEAQDFVLCASLSLTNQSAEEMLAQARRFGDQVAQQAQPYVTWRNAPDPARCLRVGLVSGDLRNHSVGFFMHGVLAALASEAAGRLEVHAYYNNTHTDALTDQIKLLCRSWTSIAELSDQALAERIRDDGIDILVDLSGHSALNRLPVFARKPAPIEVTWLGYLGTTGVTAIDYLIADDWTLPQAEEAYFTERIWRLPGTYLCFTAPDESVDAGDLPARENGYVTFGCFNNLHKINDSVVAVWARVLAAVPTSRLFLKAMQLAEVSAQKSVRERFALHGVDTGRLILQGFAPSRAEHLAAFQHVDIALDPFPYPGVTTSVEGLWMGVPFVTLAGKQFASRQGLGLLMNVGLPDWIASDEDDYVAKCVAHSADLDRLAVLRARLRPRILNSPVFDAPGFARHFEAALRGMWQEWCGRQGIQGLRSRGSDTHGAVTP